MAYAKRMSGVFVMKSVFGLASRCFLVVFAGWIILVSSGCSKEVVHEYAPVFYPPAPDQPRLQFLTSYKGGEDFDVEKPGFLETFVLGEGKLRVENIVNPYGVEMHDGKIYVCDVGHRRIKVMDIANNKFSIFPSGKFIKRAVNMCIEDDGTKYVADSASGVISVWNADDKLVDYFGKDLGVEPIDVDVRGNELYFSDGAGDQIFVLDKFSGKVLRKIGRGVAAGEAMEDDEFSMIADIAVDSRGSVYGSDLIKSTVTRFDSKGIVTKSYGGLGGSPDDLVRPKGIAFDRSNRMWVVDAGPATAVKVFRNDGRLLMLFGFLGLEPGNMYLPAGIHIDYDNVDLFKKYAVKGAKLEFLVLVTNQYGPHKVSVYGFGKFPEKYSKMVFEAERDRGSSEDSAEDKGETESPVSGEDKAKD